MNKTEVKRCCRTCGHCATAVKECYEGGFTEIGDLDRYVSPERCNAWFYSEAKEMCYECGRSVAWGSGLFVNRVPSFDTIEDRREMNVPYPEGEWLCGECDEQISGGGQ